MDFNAMPMFSLMKAKMGYMSARQSVLAQNVANADTPGYRAKDIAQPDFGNMVKQASHKLAMTKTDSQHVTPQSGNAQFMPMKRKSTYELNPTGNNVVIEEEMSKVAENQAEYQKVLSMYKKTVDLFKTAIGRPNGGG